jgi:hypothetical protein
MQLNSLLFPGPAIELKNVDYTSVVYIPRDQVFEKPQLSAEEESKGHASFNGELSGEVHIEPEQQPNRLPASSFPTFLSCGLSSRKDESKTLKSLSEA